MRTAIEAGHDAAERTWKDAFDATEAITGNEPMVPTTHLRSQARSVLRTAQRTPYGAPAGTAKLARTPETVYQFTGETVRGTRPGVSVPRKMRSYLKMALAEFNVGHYPQDFSFDAQPGR